MADTSTTTESAVFATPADELLEVNNAISRILISGQSYKIGSRSLTRADLGLLYARQKELQSAIADEGDSSLFADTVVAIFDRR